MPASNMRGEGQGSPPCPGPSLCKQVLLSLADARSRSARAGTTRREPDDRPVEELALVLSARLRAELLRLLTDGVDAQRAAERLAILRGYGSRKAAEAGLGPADIQAVVGFRLKAGPALAAEQLLSTVGRFPSSQIAARRLGAGVVLDVASLVRAVSTVGCGPEAGGAGMLPDQANPDASCLALLNEGCAASLWVSPSLVACLVSVLLEDLGWGAAETRTYVELLVDMTQRSGGGVVRATGRLSGSCDFHQARVLEAALDSGSLVVLTEDARVVGLAQRTGLAAMSPKNFAAQITTGRRLERGRIRPPVQP